MQMKLNVQQISLDKRKDLLEKVFAHMEAKANHEAKTGLLLTGDPGVGKTSFIHQLADLMGIKLVVVETPHIVEEHIVNIPFIVYEPESNTTKTDSIKTTGRHDVQLANSSLYTEVMRATRVSDTVHLSKLNSETPYVKKLVEALGGTREALPEDIAYLRSKFKVILFLDEYYRETSTSIRNMLRGILNGNLGNHVMPNDIYVIYASNMHDDGGSVEAVPGNNDFRELKFDAPDKDEWFSYLISKFKDDKKGVKLNEDVINKFYDILQTSHLSHTDAESSVRTSPRRWEQLLLYINSSLPCKTEDEAKSLLTNINVGFMHYMTGARSNLGHIVLDAVIELIKETSKIEVKPTDLHHTSDWRDTLKHQIEVKMKLGEHRKYVPVVSGLPGIGKTEHISRIAIELGLVPIIIEVDKLSAEEVIGLPLSEKDGKELNVKFSEPPLYQLIKKKIAEGEKQLQERIKAFSQSPAADIKRFKDSAHKYLLFFDELNRVKPNVFNALRRVILDKSFDDELHLPPGTVVIAAINPDTTDGSTTELTHHMRDVLDIIPASATWAKTRAFMKAMTFNDGTGGGKPLRHPEVAEAVLKTLDAFHDKFSTKEDKRDATGLHFGLGASDIYISPREFVSMYILTARYMDRKIDHFKKVVKDHEQATVEEEKVKTALFESVKESLSFIIEHKHGKSSMEQFYQTLHEWFQSDPSATHFELTKKKAKINTFESIMEDAYEDINEDLYKNSAFVNYINNADATKFSEDLAEFLAKKFERDAHELIVSKHPRKVLNDDRTSVVKEKKSTEKLSHLEHFMREIIHAIKIHELSNEFFAPLKNVLLTFMGSMEEEADDDQRVFAINLAVTMYLKELAAADKAALEKKLPK